jgi:hypothetical protein
LDNTAATYKAIFLNYDGFGIHMIKAHSTSKNHALSTIEQTALDDEEIA